MFSSLASFLFGSNCETNSETTAKPDTAVTALIDENDTSLVDANNLIEVTSLTPSVTGASTGGQGQQFIKRGKNKRNNARQQNKRKGIKSNKNVKEIVAPLTPKQTKVLTPSDSCDEIEFDEDEWFIVEKEDEEQDDSPTRCDSEGENVPVIEVVETAKPITANAAYTLAQQRRLQHINSHSLYSGPRPQKHRNYLQRTRNNNNNNSNNRSVNGLSVSTLSPSRTVNVGRNGSGQEAKADGGMTRSLYAAPISPQCDEKMCPSANGLEMCNKMEESWFVTPPPCFTSIGPINMETSPYENLLIEHPSMSVYHSIKTAQEATDSFIKLDIGVNNIAEGQKANENKPKKNPQAVQNRSGSVYRLDRQSVAQLKQELMARNVQKIQTKKERKDICLSATKRANKVREVHSRNHTQRRADRQHSKIFSNVNNNRKSNSC